MKAPSWAGVYALGALIVLSGCATRAERQFQAISTNNQAASAQYGACVTALYNSPEAAPIRSRTPLKADEASLAQLADSSMANRDETQAIFALHPRLKECERAVLTEFSKSTPSFVPILAKDFSRSDDDILSLIQKKLAWGEFNRRRRDNTVATRAAIQQAAQSVTAEFRQMHRDEMAERRAAAQAIAQWAQTQQVINAMNRPVITNCNRFGTMVNCVSQ
jgi:hypothetical protein